MQITINNVDIDRQAKYSKAIVEYTNQEGKAEKKNVMSFTNKDLYSTLSAAKPGEVYDVNLGKNEKGYWEFTSAVKTGTSSAGAKPSQTTATPKSTYETPEERAARQLYIIRQSNINAAISLLSVGSKGLKVNDVLVVAKEFENYVFGKPQTPDNMNDFIEDFPEIE
jgi:hypothetical protein